MSEIDPVNYEQSSNGPVNQGPGGYLNTPNSVGVLVLGILSIVLCWCYGLVSIILGIVAIVLSNQGEKIYKANPNMYSLSSYKNMKAGKVCAIIGLCLGGLYILFLLIYFLVVGSLAFGALNSLGK